MSTIVLLAMLCAKPLTLKDPAADAANVMASCGTVTKAFAQDHKQCTELVAVYRRTTGVLSMPGYWVCVREDGADDPQMTITPQPYKAKGSTT